VSFAPSHLAYTIEDPGDGARIIWSSETVPIAVEEALRQWRDRPNPEDEVQLSECDEWLRGALAEGRILAADLRRAGREAGFSWTALNRARWRIGAVTRKDGFGPGSRCYWQERSGRKREPAPPNRFPAGCMDAIDTIDAIETILFRVSRR
jgi:hypothetical protein